MAPTAGFMTHVTCRLTAKNRDQLRNPALGNRVSAIFTFTFYVLCKGIRTLAVGDTGAPDGLGSRRPVGDALQVRADVTVGKHEARLTGSGHRAAVTHVGA